MSVLHEAAEAEAVANKEAREDFENLAIRLATHDDDPTLDEVAAVLKAVGKTTEDLKTRAAYHESRNLDRDAIEASQAAKSEREKLQGQRAAADAELEAARETHSRAVRPIGIRLSELADIDREAAEARRRLQHGCDDPEIREKMSINGMRMQALQPKINDARGRKERLQQMIATEKSQWAPRAASKWLRPGEGRGGDPEKVARLQARLDKVIKELSELEAEKNELVAESEQLYEDMIWA